VDYTIIGLVVAIALGLVVTGVAAGRRETERQMRRLALVERKLDAVLDHLGIEVSQRHLEQVEALVAQGKTVQAIRAYREATGADLLEAKQTVDRLGGTG
jgi:ribosomal protein L7/L12